MEGDDSHAVTLFNDFLFQSTPSVWRETLASGEHDSEKLFQSTPSVWRETI